MQIETRLASLGHPGSPWPRVDRTISKALLSYISAVHYRFTCYLLQTIAARASFDVYPCSTNTLASSSVFRALAGPQSTNLSLSPCVSIFPPVCREDACIVRRHFRAARPGRYRNYVIVLRVVRRDGRADNRKECKWGDAADDRLPQNVL